eukprot:6770570-Prymnesium_polylepis.1
MPAAATNGAAAGCARSAGPSLPSRSASRAKQPWQKARRSGGGRSSALAHGRPRLRSRSASRAAAASAVCGGAGTAPDVVGAMT